ncbi:MAG: response regulator [Rhodospirillales bacterium]|nr:response regulator [Rhodospirillales bacterium]
MDEARVLAGWVAVVADDEQFSRSIIVRMVRELGCADALTARNGQDALDLLRSTNNQRRLVIADFSMPKVDGLALVKCIRTGAAGVANDAPVVMLTGHSDFALVKAAMQLDVDAFVVKPASKAQLASRLGKALSEARNIKTADAYADINIDDVRGRMLSREPPGRLRPQAGRRGARNTVRLKLEDVREGQVLAEDIRAPDGELLLGVGMELNARFLRRLKELATVVKLEYLTIEGGKV